MLRTSFILIFFFIYSCALAQFKNFNTEDLDEVEGWKSIIDYKNQLTKR